MDAWGRHLWQLIVGRRPLGGGGGGGRGSWRPRTRGVAPPGHRSSSCSKASKGMHPSLPRIPCVPPLPLKPPIFHPSGLLPPALPPSRSAPGDSAQLYTAPMCDHPLLLETPLRWIPRSTVPRHIIPSEHYWRRDGGGFKGPAGGGQVPGPAARPQRADGPMSFASC